MSNSPLPRGFLRPWKSQVPLLGCGFGASEERHALPGSIEASYALDLGKQAQQQTHVFSIDRDLLAIGPRYGSRGLMNAINVTVGNVYSRRNKRPRG